jgi:U3 small nucleolar RNA-associated protein 22
VLSSDSPIPLHRLSPSHSNIRINSSSNTTNVDTQSSLHLPTPLYNNALLRTINPKYQLLAIHALQNECPTFSDALTLLRIWANQRGYSEGTRMCVRGFESAGTWWWSLLALLLNGEERRSGVALLLNGEERRSGVTKSSQRKSVGKGLSSYQLFKAALEFLGVFLSNDITFQSNFFFCSKTQHGKGSSIHKIRRWTPCVFPSRFHLYKSLSDIMSATPVPP